MKRLLSLALVASLLGTVPAVQATPSEASQISVYLSGLVVLGSIASAGASGTSIVESIENVGDGVVVVLKNMVDGSKATVRLSGTAAQKLSVAAGSVLDVVATSTGHLLVFSGKVLAFIPNELGKALLHHEKVT